MRNSLFNHLVFESHLENESIGVESVLKYVARTCQRGLPSCSATGLVQSLYKQEWQQLFWTSVAPRIIQILTAWCEHTFTCEGKSTMAIDQLLHLVWIKWLDRISIDAWMLKDTSVACTGNTLVRLFVRTCKTSLLSQIELDYIPQA